MRLILAMLTWLLKKLRFGQSEDGHGSSSQFEVERKYRLSQEEFDDLPSILKRSGYHFHREQQMTDTFIPALEQDDMIRIRDIRSQGKDSSVLTLKKWTVVEGERVRRERETESLDPVARDCLLEMGSRLATEALLSFSKKRVEYRGERDGKTVTIALDQVDGLGAYSGPYLEVEVLSHQESEVGEALACVEKVAFELLGGEREMSMSYMEMLKLSRAETPGR